MLFLFVKQMNVVNNLLHYYRIKNMTPSLPCSNTIEYIQVRNKSIDIISILFTSYYCMYLYMKQV